MDENPKPVRRYAIRVRGDVRRARLAADEEGLEVEVTPETTTARGWVPDQATLFGLLALIRHGGLEVAAAHRTRVPPPEAPSCTGRPAEGGQGQDGDPVAT
jgi:hypothetical protein